jgi:CheY-like chemotaxis protein
MRTGQFPTCARGHLARRSELAGARAKRAHFRDILLIDDEGIDAERLTATLRVVFGYETAIRWASTLAEGVDRVGEKRPCLVFLNDMLQPSADALRAIPLLRSAGFAGPIIVVSGQVTHWRRSGLLAEGASDVIHKDDIDSVRVAEALDRLSIETSGLGG